mmetsp:Transcript_54160/g.143276  ORF Transcript_54160/g.143276 Transcript_54160/m.143276 type:complete len:97 (-) Transcript_54160:429-719(-)
MGFEVRGRRRRWFGPCPRLRQIPRTVEMQVHRLSRHLGPWRKGLAIGGGGLHEGQEPLVASARYCSECAGGLVGSWVGWFGHGVEVSGIVKIVRHG